MTKTKIDTDIQAMNFDRVDQNLTRSGLPNFEDLKTLKEKYHIKTVINFCTKKNTVNEKDYCESLGINYIHLPWSAHFYNIFKLNYYSNIAKTFLLLTNDQSNYPIHVHCFHGRERTGMMVAIYRMVYHDYSFIQALDEMKEYGFKPHLHFTLVLFVYFYSLFVKKPSDIKV